MSNTGTCNRFLCPVVVSSTSSGIALMVSMVMHRTGHARSHCTQPMQSSILTNNCMRELGGSSHLSSGYCKVTDGRKSCFHVNRIPINGVVNPCQMLEKY